jgi:sugar lactone lactonase YvrE
MREVLRAASRGILVALGLALLAADAGAQVTLRPGDLIVLDAFAGPSGFGAVFHVDPLTGVQTEISVDGLFESVQSIAVGPDGAIYVTDCGCSDAPELLRIDPSTGGQVSLSSGNLFDTPTGVTVAPDGSIYVVDEYAALTFGTGGVIHVDPMTGVQTEVSSGGFFVDPIAIAAGPGGDLFVVDVGDGVTSASSVIRVTPATGAQALVATADDLADLWVGITVAPSGDIFVLDGCGCGEVIHVHPVTGAQTPISSGQLFDTPTGIAFGGDLFVTDIGFGSATPAVIRVNPLTGNQTYVSSLDKLVGPVALALVPGFALTVTVAGGGTGTVAGDVPGIACLPDCDETYAGGTAVTLTAVPTGGSVFAGWSGACGGFGPCAVSMTADRAVTATFAPPTFLLSVGLAGAGTGTVAGDVPGIGCLPDCSETYVAGTAVTLTALPTGGSVFAGWSGACVGLGPCVVSMTADRAVTATFALPGFLLSVGLAGAGTGAVASDVPGIGCPPACGQTYVLGTIVTLSPAPAPGSAFVGWTGACVGAGPCVVLMTADRAVTALFARPRGIVTGPGPSAGPRVRRFTETGAPTSAGFDAYAPFFAGGVFVATGNLDGAGPLEIVTGAGATGGPHVRAFDGDGTPRNTSFYAYAPTFLGGVRVAACDVDGDGRDEIVTAPGPGAAARIRVIALDALENPAGDLATFLAYDAAFTGGAFVACADVDGDGGPDVVTGADAGGGPHVRVFSLAGGLHEVVGFYAFPVGFAGGVRVAAGDVDGTGQASLVLGAGPGGTPHVRVLRWTGSALAEIGSFLAYDAPFAGGVFVGAGDVAGLGHDHVIAGAGAGGAPHVRVFTGAGADTGLSVLAYEATFGGGVAVAVGP